MSKKIIIATPQFLIKQALVSLIGDDHCLMVNTVHQLEQLLQSVSAQLLIADFDLFDENHILQIKNIKSTYSGMPVLIVAGNFQYSDFNELNRIGIKNIILKSATRDEVLTAIDSAIKGKKYYDSEVLELIIDTRESKSDNGETSNLTGSEIEIVRLIAGGLTTKEIAQRRNVSFHTINTHRKNIFKKMSVSNTSELIMKSIKAGWIDNIEYFI